MEPVGSELHSEEKNIWKQFGHANRNHARPALAAGNSEAAYSRIFKEKKTGKNIHTFGSSR